MTTETAPTPAQTSSRWEDLIDVFLSPSELFARRAADSWGKPFLLLAIITFVLYYAFLPFNALIWEAAMIENAPPNADPEQLRQGAAFMKYIGGLFVVIGTLFVIAVTAAGLKLMSSLIEPAARWGQAFTIATYAMYVIILQQLIGSLLVFMKSRSGTVTLNDASFGVMRFIEDPDPWMRAVLGRLDIFPIWTAVLTAIGLVVVVGMPRGKAIATAAIAWLLVALPGLASAALFGPK